MFLINKLVVQYRFQAIFIYMTKIEFVIYMACFKSSQVLS